MFLKSIFVCFFIFSLSLISIQAIDPVLCFKEEDAVHLLGTLNVTVEGKPHTQRTRGGRLPEEGFFDQVISCVHLIDTSSGASPATIKVIGGGIGGKYVNVMFTSHSGKPFDYVMEAYSK